jgi:hypothetical protein
MCRTVDTGGASPVSLLRDASAFVSGDGSWARQWEHNGEWEVFFFFFSPSFCFFLPPFPLP